MLDKKEREKKKSRLALLCDQMDTLKDLTGEEAAKAFDSRKAEAEALQRELEADDAEVAGAEKAAGEAAGAHRARAEFVAKSRQSLSPSIPAAALNGDKEHVEAFCEYLRTGRRSGDDRWRSRVPELAAKGGMLAPRGVLAPTKGEALMNALSKLDPMLVAKALPMLSTDDEEAGGRSGLFPAEEFVPELLRLVSERNALLSGVRIVPASGPIKTWPRLVQTDENMHGSVEMSPAQSEGDPVEGEDKADQEVAIGQAKIPLREVNGYTEFSQTLESRSNIEIMSMLREVFGDAYAEWLLSVIIGGDGLIEPEGLIENADMREVNRAEADLVGWADLVNLEHAVRPEHRYRCLYVLADEVIQSLKLMPESVDGDPSRRPLFVPNPADGLSGRLNGYPYVAHTLLGLGDVGDAMFGDPRAYILPVERDLVIERSNDYKFKSNVVAVRAWAVVGGLLVHPLAWARLIEVEAL